MTQQLDWDNKELSIFTEDSRLRIWAWHILLNKYKTKYEENIEPLSKLYIGKQLINNKIKSYLINDYKNLIVKKSLFAWIPENNNKRQIRWIKNAILPFWPQIENYPKAYFDYGTRLPNNGFERDYSPIKMLRLDASEDNNNNVFLALKWLSDRDLLILTFDLAKAPIKLKEQHLEKLKIDWEIQAARDIKFDWFKDDAFRKINILREIIKKSNKYIFNIDTNISQHWELLEQSDRLPYLSHEDLNTLIKKCKATYNQGVRREKNKGKRQYSAELKITTIDKLKSLADTYNFSIPQIIEILVKNEYIEKHYLSREEKIRKQIFESDIE